MHNISSTLLTEFSTPLNKQPLSKYPSQQIKVEVGGNAQVDENTKKKNEIPKDQEPKKSYSQTEYFLHLSNLQDMHIEEYQKAQLRLQYIINKKLEWPKKLVDQFKYSISLIWVNDKLEFANEYVFNGNQQYGIYDIINQAKKWCEANHNDNSTIKLWYDSKHTTPEAVERTKALIKKECGDRVVLVDVEEIPFVKANKDFFKDDIPVYFRVDILKLVILLYEMEAKGQDSAIFTDFSICGKTEEALTKEELYKDEIMDRLESIGILIANDYWSEEDFFSGKPENQFIQALNTPILIQALKDCINSCMTLVTGQLNVLRLQPDEVEDFELHQAVYKMTLGLIQTYLLALKCKEQIKIRADVVNEGAENQWVDYDPQKHNYVFFGTHYDGCDKKGVHFDKDKNNIKVSNTIKFSEMLKGLETELLWDGLHQELAFIVRNDVNPSKTGSTHEYTGPLPKPLQGDKFVPIYWDDAPIVLAKEAVDNGRNPPAKTHVDRLAEKPVNLVKQKY